MTSKEFAKHITSIILKYPEDWEVKTWRDSKKRILQHKSKVIIEIDKDFAVYIGDSRLGEGVSISLPLALSKRDALRVKEARDSCLRLKAAKLLNESLHGISSEG